MKNHKGTTTVGKSQRDKRQISTGKCGLKTTQITALEFFRLKKRNHTLNAASLTLRPSHPHVKVSVADGKEQNDPKMSVLFPSNKEKLSKIHKTAERKAKRNNVSTLVP